MLISYNSHALKEYYGINLRFMYNMTETFQETSVMKLVKFVELSKEYSD